MLSVEVLKALANQRRLLILEWLRDPVTHFPPQADGDLENDGVCAVLIANKLEMTQPAAGEHLKLLTQVGLIEGQRIKQWTFYRRNDERIEEVKREFQSGW